MCEAFAMGLQARLGEESLVMSLDPELVKMIITSANKLPVPAVSWWQQEHPEDPNWVSDSSESDEED